MLLAAAAAVVVAVVPAAVAVASDHHSVTVQFVADTPLPGTHAVPVVAFTGSAEPWVTASMPDGSVGDPDAVVAYQWLRLSGSTVTPIPGATDQHYLLTATDAASRIAVRATITKPGYDTLVLRSLDHATTVSVPTPPVIETSSGPFEVDSRLQLPDFDVEYEGAPFHSAGPSYQWLRNGVAITGATAAMYTPVPADLSKRISVRVTLNPITPTFLPYTFTTGQTVPLALGTLKPYDIPNITRIGPMTPTGYFMLQANTYDVATPEGTMTIKWYRDNVVVPPYSKNSTHLYQLTSADAGHKIKVVVTQSKPGFKTLVQSSDARSYTITQVSKPVIVGAPVPGNELHLDVPVELTRDLAPYPDSFGMTAHFTWYRSGAAIPNSDADSYTVTAADLGKTISFGVVGKETGYFSSSYRSPSTAAVDYPKPSTPAEAVDESALTDDAKGAIAGPVTGKQSTAITLNVGAAHSREWVSVWAFSAPVRVSDWVKVGSTGAITVTLPAQLTSGDHKLVVQTATGEVLGWRSIHVAGGAYPAAEPGSVLVTDGPFPLHGSIDGFPNGTKVTAYQWYRVPSPGAAGIAISGATRVDYTPTAADAAYTLRLRAAVTVPGYASTYRFSDPLGYAVTKTSGGISLAGSVQLGSPIGTVDTLAYADRTGAVTPDVSYQWLADGKPISGASFAAFTPTSAQAGKRISVQVIARVPGRIPLVITSAQTGAVAAHAFNVLEAELPELVMDPASNTLSASVGFDVPVGTKVTYTWYRSDLIVPGQSNKYKLTAADYNKELWVRVTLSKTGYTPLAISSPRIDYSLHPDDTAGVAADPAFRVGGIASAIEPAYSQFGSGVTPNFAFQWYRSGVAIAGATHEDYPIAAADYGKKLTVRITASLPGSVASVLTSAPSVAIAQGVTTGAATVTVERSIAQPALTAVVDGSAIQPASPTPIFLYQWFRGTAAIPGATTAGYTMVPADSGKTVWVRVTVSRPGFDMPAATVDSTPTDYSMDLVDFYTGLSVEHGYSVQVGWAITANSRYSDEGTYVDATRTFQWYRGSAAITGAKSASYTPTVTDRGQVLSVQVTATAPGYAPLSHRITATAPVGTGTFEYASMWIPVYRDVHMLATVAKAQNFYPGPYSAYSETYQWLSDGHPIAGATKQTLQLTLARDYNHTISVRVIYSRPGMTSITRVYDGWNATLTTDGPPVIDDTTPSKGQTLHIVPPQCVLHDQAGSLSCDLLEDPAPTYQWFVGGIAVAGSSGKSSTFVVPSSAVGKPIKVSVTYRSNFYFSKAVTSASTSPVTVAP